MPTWKQFRSWLVVTALTAAAAALGQALPHVGPGPYKVGFSQVVEVQPSTPLGARPLIFSIFYPVEAAAVTSSTPRPLYALNPISSPRVFPSAAFDQFGYEPSYSGLPVAPGGPYPLVLYSHGYGATWVIGLHFAPKLASYGYVVVALGHLGDGMHEAAALKLRDFDMKFAIDRMLQRNAAAGDLLAGAIDPARIAATGWSFGGYSATVLAGGDDNVCEYLSPNPPPWACAPITPDPRVKALVLLDPSTWVLNFAELTRVSVPVISIHQSYDSFTAVGEWGGWNAFHHAAFSGAPNLRVDLEHSNHFRFSIACEFQWLLGEYGYITHAQRTFNRNARGCDDPALIPTWSVAHPIIAEYVVAFLETHVAGKNGLQWILTPGHALTSESWIQFFVTEKISPHTPESAIHEFWFFPYQGGSAVEQASVEGPGYRPALAADGVD